MRWETSPELTGPFELSPTFDAIVVPYKYIISLFIYNILQPTTRKVFPEHTSQKI